MATPKQAHSVLETAEAHNAFDEQDNVKALLKIEGLQVFQHDDNGEIIFEMSGLKRREIDMHAALLALGITEEELDDETLDALGDKISRVVQDHDLMNLLRKRIKFIG